MASGTLVWFAALGSLGLFTVLSRTRKKKPGARRDSARPGEDRAMIASLRDPALRVLFADTRTLRRALHADPALDPCRVDELQLWADAVHRLSSRYPPLSAAPVEFALRATTATRSSEPSPSISAFVGSNSSSCDVDARRVAHEARAHLTTLRAAMQTPRGRPRRCETFR